MTIKDRILEIKRLQEEARTLQVQSSRLLEEADKLTEEVKAVGGNRFVCDGVPYRFEHKSKYFQIDNMAGNRDWLVLDTDVKVIE